MSQTDLDINRAVRTVLVKHWIDLGRLSVRSSDGKLYIRGSLNRIAGINEELTSSIVDAMFAEIKRIKTIRQVYPALENWSNDTGSWSKPGGGKGQQQKGDQQLIQKTTEVYELKQKQEDQ